ncbi:MAG: hypothetical protein WAR37_03445 [Candidatus Microsaccharimonas sp.]
MNAIDIDSKQGLADRDALFPSNQLNLDSPQPDEDDQDFPPNVIPSENNAVDRYRMSLVTPELEQKATTLLDFVDDWAVLKMRAQLVVSIYKNEPLSHEALRDTIVIPAYGQLVNDYRTEAERALGRIPETQTSLQNAKESARHAASGVMQKVRDGEVTSVEKRLRGLRNLTTSYTSVAAYLERISTSGSTSEIDKKVATYAHVARKQAIEEVIQLLQDKHDELNTSGNNTEEEAQAFEVKIDALNKELRALKDLDEEVSGNPDFDKLFATLDTGTESTAADTLEKPILAPFIHNRTLYALGQSAKNGLAHLSFRP